MPNYPPQYLQRDLRRNNKGHILDIVLGLATLLTVWNMSGYSSNVSSERSAVHQQQQMPRFQALLHRPQIGTNVTATNQGISQLRHSSYSLADSPSSVDIPVSHLNLQMKFVDLGLPSDPKKSVVILRPFAKREPNDVASLSHRGELSFTSGHSNKHPSKPNLDFEVSQPSAFLRTQVLENSFPQPARTRALSGDAATPGTFGTNSVGVELRNMEFKPLAMILSSGLSLKIFRFYFWLTLTIAVSLSMVFLAKRMLLRLLKWEQQSQEDSLAHDMAYTTEITSPGITSHLCTTTYGTHSMQVYGACSTVGTDLSWMDDLDKFDI